MRVSWVARAACLGAMGRRDARLVQGPIWTRRILMASSRFKSGVLLATIGLSVLPLGLGYAQEVPPQRRSGTPLTRRDIASDVEFAIARGLAWLRTKQEGSGAYGSFRDGQVIGRTALVTYALAACGARSEVDPCLRKGVEFLKPVCTPYPRDANANYIASIVLLMLAAQGESDVSRAKEWIATLTDGLVRAQTEGGGFGYGSPAGSSEWDNSNGQVAIMGLLASSRCGMEVPEQVWVRSSRHFLGCQARNGPVVAKAGTEFGENAVGRMGDRGVVRLSRARGWTYNAHANAEVAGDGSMTSGGVSSLAAALIALGQSQRHTVLRANIEAGLRDGLAWLASAFTVEGNATLPPFPEVPAARYHYYYLWGLERACDIAGVERLGGHDWYAEGAMYLLARQRLDGSWREADWNGAGERGKAENVPEADSDDDIINSCFALLFLARSAKRLVGTRGIDSGSEMSVLGPASVMSEAEFEACFEIVFRRFTSASAVKRALRSVDFIELGVRSLPLLLSQLRSNDESVREAAYQALRLAIPGGPARGGSQERVPWGTKVREWEDWWERSKGTVMADRVHGVFVVP